MLALYFLMMAEAMKALRILSRLISEHSLAECLVQHEVLNKCQVLPVYTMMCLYNGE